MKIDLSDTNCPLEAAVVQQLVCSCSCCQLFLGSFILAVTFAEPVQSSGSYASEAISHHAFLWPPQFSSSRGNCLIKSFDFLHSLWLFFPLSFSSFVLHSQRLTRLNHNSWWCNDDVTMMSSVDSVVTVDVYVLLDCDHCTLLSLLNWTTPMLLNHTGWTKVHPG